MGRLGDGAGDGGGDDENRTDVAEHNYLETARCGVTCVGHGSIKNESVVSTGRRYGYAVLLHF
jgi:hypothetical protein